MEEKLSIEEVLNEVEDWLETNWEVSSISPSQIKDVLNELEDMLMMTFEDILSEYQNLSLDPDCFDFDMNDNEFDMKLSELIKDHIDYLESQVECYDDEDDW